MTPEQQIALCIGHSRFIGERRDGGAVAADGKTNEWTFNRFLASLIAEFLHDQHGLNSVIIDAYQGTSYSKAMRWLAAELKEIGGVALAVELHFNAANGKAGGHEWLHWHNSKHATLAAMELHMAVSQALPALKCRGLKPIGASDRGGEFLRLTHCPSVICEPFFGDNPQDWALANGAKESLAIALAAGLAAASKRL
jgi:N-acetylmuramoyl-L-alanine amidase